MFHLKKHSSTLPSVSAAKAVAKRPIEEGLCFIVWIYSTRFKNFKLPLVNTVEFLDIERKKTSVDFSRVMIEVSLTEAKAKSKLY